MEIAVLAIVSSEPLYRLAWLINQQTGWGLAESTEIKIIHKERKEVQPFFVFSYHDEDKKCSYSLIQNKGERGPMIATMRQIDFWLRIDGNKLSDVQNLIDNLKEINQIQFVQKVEAGSMKKEKKLFSLDLFGNHND